MLADRQTWVSPWSAAGADVGALPESLGNLLVLQMSAPVPVRLLISTLKTFTVRLPPGKAAVCDSALLLEKQQRHLCYSQYCISRTRSVAFEILLPTPHIPPCQLGKMPGGGDGPLPRVAVPRRGPGAERCEPSLLGLGKRGSQASDRGMECKYSISCKVN